MQQFSKEAILKLGIANPIVEAHIIAQRTTPGITWESMLQSLVIELHRQIHISQKKIEHLSTIIQEADEEIGRLRRDCSEAYQVVGCGMLMEPVEYTQGDVERALDNLIAAANGEARPHDDLLPWPKVVG